MEILLLENKPVENHPLLFFFSSFASIVPQLLKQNIFIMMVVANTIKSREITILDVTISKLLVVTCLWKALNLHVSTNCTLEANGRDFLLKMFQTMHFSRASFKDMLSPKAVGQLFLHYSEVRSQGSAPTNCSLQTPYMRRSCWCQCSFTDCTYRPAGRFWAIANEEKEFLAMHWKKWPCFQPFGSQVIGALEKWRTNYSFKPQVLSNGRWLTYPLRHTTSRASRYPWYAARRVGVIPASSEVLRSFLVASFRRSKLPSAAALWYLLDIFSNFWFPKAALNNIQTVQSPFHYRHSSLMITSWDVLVKLEMRRQSSS